MYLKDYILALGSFLVNKEKRKWLKLCYALKGKRGIEIGGPSAFFKSGGYFPVYLFANTIDGVNYSNQTVWEGQLNEGNNYNYYNDKKGYQFIGEASQLEQVKTAEYDFLLSCHSLEHVANPIKVLKEWKRILKPGGKLMLVLPDKKNTFDNKRQYTKFNHLLDDYKNEVTEKDETHFNEILELHDLNLENPVLSKQELKVRLYENYINRCAHHHVFSLELIDEMLVYCGYTVICQQEVHSLHLVTFAESAI